MAVVKLYGSPRSQSPAELLVALPRFAQVMLAAGDRHLAANLSGFRVLVASTQRMGPEDYAVQARLQEDIAWFNPAHEDNYYVAAAILPWNGQLDSAEFVLRKAVAARPQDWQPAFYLGFHHFHFLKNPAEGAKWLLAGVPAAHVQTDKWALESLAAQWLEKGYSAEAAASMVDAMAERAPPGSFRHYLKLRAERLKDLVHLRKMADVFKARYGRSLASVDELVTAELIPQLPSDPLGAGYALDPDGVPVFKPMGKLR